MNNHKLRINYLIDKFAFLMLKNQDITAIGRGRKIINGAMTDIPSLTIYVEKKVNSDNLSKDRIIPKYFNGIITDILESPIESLCANKKDPRIYGGSEISTKLDNGTVGYIVNDIGNKDKIYILTSNHLVNPEFENKLGRKVYILDVRKDGEYIYLGKAVRIVDVKKGALTIEKANKVDGALISVEYDSEIIKKLIVPALDDRNHTVVRGTAKAIEPGDKVYMVGVETGYIEGIIGTVNLAGIFKTNEKKEELYFSEQIRTTIPVKAGDSGALGVKKVDGNASETEKADNNKAVGLLMAGSEKASTFNNINIVLEGLKVELVKL